MKLIELYNEIKINKPNQIWDFTKYISGFDFKQIKVGDFIKYSIGDRVIQHEIIKITGNNDERWFWYNNDKMIPSGNLYNINSTKKFK